MGKTQVKTWFFKNSYARVLARRLIMKKTIQVIFKGKLDNQLLCRFFKTRAYAFNKLSYKRN